VRALLYDIHGNLPALDAVLADAHSAGAESFVLGGDYVLFGAYPAETLERLGRLDAVWIRGNTDRWVAGDEADAPASPLVQGAITHSRVALAGRGPELEALPASAPLDGVLFCHASPQSDMESFFPTPGPDDERLLEGAAGETVVFGHTHLQFRRESGGKLLVNPGSVGMPFDADRRAAYALWRDDGEIELRRVEYDVDAYVGDLQRNLTGMLGVGVETLVRRLEQAAFVD
jgi:predicted phosphodiesterase